MAIIFDCEKIATHHLALARLRNYPFKPHLTIIRKGDDSASIAYEKAIKKTAKAIDVCVESALVKKESELIQKIKELNLNPDINGIILLAPLNCSLPDYEFANLVHPSKDIEGRNAINLGYLYQFKKFLNEEKGVKCVVPATAKAAVKILQYYQLPKEPSFITILNDSAIVGRPLGTMLKNLSSTVVNCHIGTKKEDLECCIENADYLITAVPNPNFKINSKLVKKGAAIMDISYEGNIDHSSLMQKASYITPEKGGKGVGKVTTSMIFTNLNYCCERQYLLKEDNQK